MGRGARLGRVGEGNRDWLDGRAYVDNRCVCSEVMAGGAGVNEGGGTTMGR